MQHMLVGAYNDVFYYTSFLCSSASRVHLAEKDLYPLHSLGDKARSEVSSGFFKLGKRFYLSLH